MGKLTDKLSSLHKLSQPQILSELQESIEDKNEVILELEKKLRTNESIKQNQHELIVNQMKCINKMFTSTIKRMLNENLILQNIQNMYEILKPLDKEGWHLYHACNEVLKVDPATYFYAEEVQGWFTESNGHDLTKWAEIARFHEIEYEINGAYECYVRSKFDENKRNEYELYKSELYIKAIKDIAENPINQYYEDYEDSEYYENINKIIGTISSEDFYEKISGQSKFDLVNRQASESFNPDLDKEEEEDALEL